MGKKIKLWTRQDERILDILDKDERYIARKEYIIEKMDTCADVYLDVYGWYAKKAETIVPKPKDVNYPIWVSLKSDYMLQPTDGAVILELMVDKSLVIIMDTLKWDYIVNYWYIPESKEDQLNHDKLLKKYGLSDDSSIYMSNFYPHLKKELINSWDRLFDDSYSLSKDKQGTIWEVKKEWISKIIK